ncbi:MAG: hypothetical protein Q7U54_05035 [Bacteroidales bacterium]|nr:hypothetical protein [Bacteroidales bacterium]
MKARTKVLTLLLAVALSSAIMPKQVSAQQYDISFQVFYDQLSPYGQWMDNPAYGYVWIPDAGSDFVPYSTAGHWIMTDYGWTWVSDYDWGWAPFHYGRWDYDDYLGWFWVPDTEWGPSWVVWRRAEGYYGWAPMQPGISINVYLGNNYNMQNEHWMFVRDRDFQRTNLNRYYADRSVRQRIIVNSTIINTTYVDNSRHTTYVSGPRRDDVQRNTGKTVNSVVVQEYNKPGAKLNKGKLQIYRPEVVKNTTNGRKSVPSRIVNKQDVKQPSGRNTNAQPGKTVPANKNVRQQQQDQQRKQKIQQQQQQQKQKIDQQKQKPPVKQQDQQKQKQDQQKQQQDQQKRQQDQQKQQQDQQRQQQNQQKQQKQQPVQQQRQQPAQQRQQPAQQKQQPAPQKQRVVQPKKVKATPKAKEKKKTNDRSNQPAKESESIK